MFLKRLKYIFKMFEVTRATFILRDFRFNQRATDAAGIILW